MDRRVPIKTLYLLVVVFIGLIGLAVGSTFAIFEASIEIDNPISLSSNLTYEDEVMQTITVKLRADEIKTITLNVSNQTGNEMKYNTWYEESDNSIDFGTEDDMIGIVNALYTKTLTITIRNNENKNIELLIGVSVGTGDSSVVLADNMQVIPKQTMPKKIINKNLATFITNLYSTADKDTVDNGDETNGIVTYNTASSVNLMNDRLGGVVGPNDGNIRYYGGNPNNYIYFNCDDYSNQSDSTCEIWRIIGVFDTIEVDEDTGVETPKKMAKIIRTESIGNYSWDTSPSSVDSGWGVNQWGPSKYTDDSEYTGADLMKLLNPGFDDNGDLDASGNTIIVNNSLYWNRTNGNCYNSSSNSVAACNFTTSGIKDSTKNLIADVIWNTGGTKSSSVFSHNMYLYERGTRVVGNGYDPIIRTTSWIGKVALIYASDYGYARDFSKCNLNLTENCGTENNYISSFVEGQSLTPFAISDYYRDRVESFSHNIQGIEGLYGNGGSGYEGVTGASKVNPSLYLNSDTILYSGEGTSEKPYKIKIN